MPSKLGEWLKAELAKRGWSMRRLALRSDVSPVTVGNIVRRDVKPEVDTVLCLAEGLGEDPVFMLRLAGILPDLVPETTEEEEVVRILRTLPHHLRQAVVWMIRGAQAEYHRGVQRNSPRSLAEGERVRVVLMMEEGTVVREGDEPNHYLVKLDESPRVFHRDQLLEVTLPPLTSSAVERTGGDRCQRSSLSG
jgi:transcriptional regulator with XRE-family HTH domain